MANMDIFDEMGIVNEDRLNYITCLTWVKRGVAKQIPDKIKLTEEELDQMLKGSKKDGEECDGDSEDSDNQESPAIDFKNESDNTESRYGFEKYDEEIGDSDVVGGISGLTMFSSNKHDPYVTVKDDSDNDSEKDDDMIGPDDNLILVGHVNGAESVLEVYVQNEKEDSLYVHHDIALPILPFCVEWLSYDPTSETDANLCAVGGMAPVIFVMDLDIVDCMEPAYVLGNAEFKSNDPIAVQFRKKSKKKVKSKVKHIGHKDAVLSLSWNKNFTHVLASGSKDETVLLWDLENGTVNTKFDPFKNMIQSIQWHPFEGQTLLTGCDDRVARVFDCRSGSYKAWETDGEIEKVIWDHFNPFFFLTSSETGMVQYVDCRADKPIWKQSLHEKSVSGLSLSSSCPGLLFTASVDEHVKAWDIQNQQSPVLVWESDAKMGNVHCLGSSPDSPFTIAAGGDKRDRKFGLWDLSENPAVQQKFSNRPLLVPSMENETDTQKAEPSNSKSENQNPKESVMETVATALDDLCLSINSSNELKKLSGHSKVIKKTKKKGKHHTRK